MQKRMIRHIAKFYAVYICDEDNSSKHYELHEHFITSNEKLHRNYICSMKSIKIDKWEHMLIHTIKSYWLLLILLLGLINILVSLNSISVLSIAISILISAAQLNILIKGIKGRYPIIPRWLLRLILKHTFKIYIEKK